MTKEEYIQKVMDELPPLTFASNWVGEELLMPDWVCRELDRRRAYAEQLWESLQLKRIK